MKDIGIVVMMIGAAIAVVGGFIATGWFGWFGRLPGDIRIATDSTRIYIPLTSMLLISIVLSLAAALWRRLL